MRPHHDPRNSFLRRGFSLTEVIVVLGVIATLTFTLLPRITELKTRSQLRSARQELSAAFASARAAAIQKGKVATLTLDASSATVTVRNGLTGTTITIFGPIRFDILAGATLGAVSSSPLSIQFDQRGSITPASANVLKYRLSRDRYADTVCVSAVGLVMLSGCTL